MRRDSRGQSETVGVVLLTAVIVVLSVIIGVFILSNFDGNDRTEPIADINTETQGQQIIIEHFGGENYDANSVTVIARGEYENQWKLAEFTPQSQSGQQSFSPGERWVLKDIGDLSGEFEILIVDEDSGKLLDESSHDVNIGSVQFESVNIPKEVKQNEEVRISAELAGTGDVDLTQNVTATITNTSSDTELSNQSKTVTVSRDQPKLIEFTYPVGQTATSNLNVKLSVGEISISESVNVLEVSELQVNIDKSASLLSVTDQEHVVVAATLENTGDTGLTQTVVVAVDNSTQSVREVDVPAGQTRDVTVQFPAKSAFNEQNVRVKTEDDSANAKLDVSTVGELQISGDIDAPETATQGDNIAINANLINTGDVELTQNINFVVKTVAGKELKNETMEQTLGGGKERRINFTHKINDSRTENLKVEVRTESTNRSETVSVVGEEDEDLGYEFRIADPPENAIIERGEALTVIVESETTSFRISQVEVMFDKQTQEQRVSDQMEFLFDTTSLSPGEYTIEATRNTLLVGETASDEITIEVVQPGP